MISSIFGEIILRFTGGLISTDWDEDFNRERELISETLFIKYFPLDGTVSDTAYEPSTPIPESICSLAFNIDEDDSVDEGYFSPDVFCCVNVFDCNTFRESCFDAPTSKQVIYFTGKSHQLFLDLRSSLHISQISALQRRDNTLEMRLDYVRHVLHSFLQGTCHTLGQIEEEEYSSL